MRAKTYGDYWAESRHAAFLRVIGDMGVTLSDCEEVGGAGYMVSPAIAKRLCGGKLPKQGYVRSMPGYTVGRYPYRNSHAWFVIPCSSVV